MWAHSMMMIATSIQAIIISHIRLTTTVTIMTVMGTIVMGTIIH